MECNKDEATRAKEISEKKFLARDVAGAKKFALKAQNLYPGLENLTQMLATFDVHLAAENKIGGEPDWYGILGVNPVADDETVKKQYRKLALVLHPDKNKSIGADEAFKLISQAWSNLSDKIKRTTFDHMRFSETSHQKVSYASGGPSGANGFHNFSKPSGPKASTQKSNTKMGPTTATTPSRPSKANTFWTACHRCKMQYEYLRVYLNHNLLCPNCHEAFLAVETQAPPSKGSESSNPPWNPQTRQNSNQKASKNVGSAGFSSPDSFHQMNFQFRPFSKTAGVGSSTSSPSTAAQAANVVQQAYEKVKRQREEAQAAIRKKEAHRKKYHVSKRAASTTDSGGERATKKRNVDDSYGVNMSGPRVPGTGGARMNSASGFMQGGFDKDRTTVPKSVRDLSQLELRNMLAEKARREMHKKLDEWRGAAAAYCGQKEKGKQKETEQKEKEKETVASNGNISDHNNLVETVDTKKGVQDKVSLDTSDVDLPTEASEPLSMSVPDPDFHDFDRDRSERCFGENHVWAAYDDDDGMPRYYAMIHKVISLRPFKMRISWLNSKTNNELGPLNWVGSGFPKTCGDFRVGKYEVNNSLNSFSHKVMWTKGTRGAVQIFPRKGDVWALYRNWSPDWSELTPDEVIHKYDMVEVLDDYDEEQGVSVTPLVKVAGFKTVFHRHMDPKEIKKIPREEMFRFSHQVPSYLLTGSEAQNAPKGCRELDPAATPLELLQIKTETKEEEMAAPAELTVLAAKKTVMDGSEQILEAKEEMKADNTGGQVRTRVKENGMKSDEKDIVNTGNGVGASENTGKTNDCRN